MKHDIEGANTLRRTFVDDEGGFTSLGAAVAMLLAVALVVSTARVCWVESRAGDIQFAADAGALASENVVAEYLTAAQVADACVLSMSLLGLSLHAVSAVAACIPVVGAEVAAGTSRVAHAVMDARDRVADVAANALNKLQKALPFLCAMNAMAVIQANGDALGAPAMTGIAVPLPIEGLDVVAESSSAARDVGGKADATNADTARMSDEAASAAQRMDESKLVAYQADCGANPDYCLYQRASTLAGLPDSQNPYYASVEAWSFSVPLERARSYYRARLAAEPGEALGFSDPAETVRSIARARFYKYALERVEAGSVTQDGDVVHADLPLLPHNTAEVRETPMYTEAAWPLTSAEGVVTLHASASCPQALAEEAAGTGSLAQIDEGGCSTCPVCAFDVGTLGSVPAASTSIDNGFEHYWRIIAQEAGDYTEASSRYASQSAGAKRNVEDVLGGFKTALAALGAQRIDAQPPGRYGSIAIAIDPERHEVPVISGALGGGEASMGRRVAMSAATLTPDAASSKDNLLSSIFAGLRSEAAATGGDPQAFGAAVASLLDGIAGVWGDLLFAYSKGTQGLLAGIDNVLGKIPVVGSELSEWATSRLKEVIALLGIEPATLDMHKPVTCNTVDVAQRGGGEAADAVLRLRALAVGMGSTGLYGLVGSLATTARGRFDARMEEGFTIRIKLVAIDGFPEIPITFKPPHAFVEAGEELINNAAGRLQALTEEMGALERVWR